MIAKPLVLTQRAVSFVPATLDIPEMVLNAQVSCTPLTTNLCHGRNLSENFFISDINECALGMDNCDRNADCTDTEGSFTCTCELGYTGDGTTCSKLVCFLDIF